MRNIFEKLIDVLIYLAIILGLILSYYGQRQDTLTQQYVSTEASNLIDTVQTQGKLTKDVYEDFLLRLNHTNMLYDIRLEHKELAIEPEYRLKTAEEIIDEQNAAYNGENIYHYFPVSTEIPEVNDPNTGNGLNMNNETNESILAKAVNTPSMGHTHTDDCYVGHVHKGGDNLTFTHTHTHVAGSCYKGYIAFYYDIKCNACGQTHRIPNSWYHLGPTGNSIFDSYNPEALKYCSNCGSTNVQQVGDVIPSWAYTCGYSKDITGDGVLDDIPYGVAYTYNCPAPQNNNRATYTSGCYKFHSHKDYHSETVYSSAGYISNTRMLMNMVNNGLLNYCVLPQYYTLGVDTLENDSRDYPNSNRVYYNATYSEAEGLVYHYGGFNLLESYYNYDRPNPGFKETMTPAEFEYLVKNFYEEFRRIVGYAPYSSEGSNYHYISFFSGGDLKMCNETINNQWYLACGKEEDGHLACNQMVISIVPTNPIQAVYTNESLITTATATYRDGSTKVVVCTTDFETKAPVNNATVTLSYTDATGHKLTTMITVTVVPRNRTCANGHKYNLNNNGSDPGCPYCRSWLRSLEVADPATGSITIYRGTTLQDNGVILMATYLDGRKELVDTGYVNNLDKNYIGRQTVTISYKGKNTTLNVTVKRNIVQCSVCRRFYELYPDDTDPGCPYCKARVPVFTGKVLKYYADTYSNGILDEIYGASEAYYFEQGDYLSISVTNRVNTIGTKILKIFFHTAPKVTIHVEKGGEIRNEAAKGVK